MKLLYKGHFYNFWRSCRDKIFENCVTNSKVHSQREKHQIKSGERFLPCILQSFFLQSAVWKLKNQNIQPAFLYGCETWSRNLRQYADFVVWGWCLGEYFDIRGMKWSGWSIVHNDECHSLYSSSSLASRPFQFSLSLPNVYSLTNIIRVRKQVWRTRGYYCHLHLITNLKKQKYVTSISCAIISDWFYRL
jgi:hypothetical protein